MKSIAFPVHFVFAFLGLLASEVAAQQEAIAAGRYRFAVLAGAPDTKGHVDAAGAAARFDRPGGIAVDATSNVYISEYDLCTIRKISWDGVVTTLAGVPGQSGSQDGMGSTARFRKPAGLAVDGAGNVYVADSGNHTIRKISPSGTVTTLAGKAGETGSRDGAAAQALFEEPYRIAADKAGNLFVTEGRWDTRIRKITSEDTVSTLDLLPPDHFAGYIQVSAIDLRVDRAGTLYVLYFDVAMGEISEVWSFKPRADGQYEADRALRPPFYGAQVSCIALDDADNLYVRYNTDPIYRFAPAGGVEVRYGFGGSGGYIWMGLTVDNRGRIFTLPYSYHEKLGVIEVGTFDPAADGLTIVQQPFDNVVQIGNTFSTTLTVGAAGASAFTYQWFFNSNPVPGATNPHLTLNNVKAADVAGTYFVVVTDPASNATVTSRTARFELSRYREVAAGESFALIAPASGTPGVTFRWQKDGAPIAGATAATLTFSNVQEPNTGAYTVVATYPDRTTTSTVFTVVVISPPAITRQPVSVTVARGSTAVFSVSATGGPTYLWRRNGEPIVGAFGATLVVSPAIAGTYSVETKNLAGTVTSTAASLEVSDDADFGHLINLSVRARLTASDPSLTVGTVVGGGRGASLPLLVRALGPSLSELGVPTGIADPQLEVLAGGGAIAGNNDWGGDAALRNAAAAVGAVPLPANSKDAAVFGSFGASDYAIRVSGVGGATGDVLAELYDANATTSAAGPHLVNVSALKRIDAGDSLTAGFVIGGTTARTMLVRAVGPSLAALNVPGPMSDPQLALFNAAQTKIAENDNWSHAGLSLFLNVFGDQAGAFRIADLNSKDAMLLITLPPGSYTAQVSGRDEGGSVVVEVYEVP